MNIGIRGNRRLQVRAIALLLLLALFVKTCSAQVYCSGWNAYGQIGDGTFTDRLVPTPVVIGSGFLQISTKHDVVIALKNDGTVWTWGRNELGALGDGTTVSKSVPNQVAGLASIRAVSAGWQHCLALDSQGQVWSWGCNRSGQVGDGTGVERHRPVKLTGLPVIKAIECGSEHSLALAADGTVWAWGLNDHGQLGQGDKTDRLSPVKIQGLSDVTQLAAGQGQSLALLSSGYMKGWGYNWAGQVGNNSTEDCLTPVGVSLSLRVKSVSANWAHSIATTVGGTVLGWGWNGHGEIGDGTTTNRLVPTPVVGLTNVKDAKAGLMHSMALLNSGRVLTWGYNWAGQLANGTVADQSLPAYVVFGKPVAEICGGGYNSSFRCAETPSGISSFVFDPASISSSGTSAAVVRTFGTVKALTIRADPGQGVPTTPIAMKRTGDIWNATVSGALLINRNCNPVSFTATAVTSDSGNPTLGASLTISVPVGAGKIAGQKSDRGEPAGAIACDNPADFDERAATDSSILARANKLELVLPAGMTAVEDVGSACLNGSKSPFDANGDSNAGRILVRDEKVWFLPPDELNVTQRPNQNQLYVSPVRAITVSAKLKLKDGRIIYFDDYRIKLVRPVVVLIHGINNDSGKWTDFVVGDYGKFLSGPAIPYARLDHSQVEGGNGPVEYGAQQLQELISNLLWRLRSGQFAGDSMSMKGGGRKFNYTFTDYYNLRIASKRVDIVAHSYGGVIARWYLASRGTTDSLGWYKREGTDTSMVTNPSSYADDVRKVITFGSMWRGVPMCNYVNEARFHFVSNGHRFADAPIPPNDSLEDWLNAGAILVSTTVPSMEVMAIDSPWLSQLIYGTPDPYAGNLSSTPFQGNVAFGSVAGDDENYSGMFDGVYGLFYTVQQPSWFPYIGLEYDPFSGGVSDGIVPVWSAAIPGSSIFVHKNHTNLPGDTDAHNYAIQWLNHAGLPNGAVLNGIWRTLGLELIDSLTGKSWRFMNDRMAPSDRYDFYKQHGGIGRLNPAWWGP
jgi:alpha-tubulin suppressor-like RCC1 family protein/pimeloyl-ACP methyl ester carboxylesterase